VTRLLPQPTRTTAAALPRRCSCGGFVGPSGECAQCRAKRLLRQRDQASPARLTGVARSVDDVLRSAGRPLEPAVRGEMEARLGHDFSRVRVHTDARASDSAQAVDALAYTVGRDIVFRNGEFAPQSPRGRRLLAHELVHTVQAFGRSSSSLDADAAEREADALSRAALDRPRRLRVAVAGSVRPGMLQRQLGPGRQLGPTKATLLTSLLEDIDRETTTAIQLRTELEMMPATSSARRIQVEAELDRTRESLLRHLEQRVAVLPDEIEALNRRIGPAPVSMPGRPDLDAPGLELMDRQRELAEHQAQLRPLKRWQTQRRIHSIEAEMARIDAEIATLEPVSDPAHPRAEQLALRRDDLEREKRTLAASLTTTAVRFRQGDPRWGTRRYGQNAACTSVAAAGCGPTSLAILLNYLFQEDPEMLAAPGQIELVTPGETAGYAETHGRVCNNGTSGDTMVTDVPTRWPGFRGQKIALDQATSALRSGSLVIFLCHSCTAADTAGKTKTYGGHFMVLNSVDEAARQFGVIDPAGANVVTITRAELTAHTGGFWTVERK
jgi:Domain of unknown function (DUF4157)/Peptidase_C39 like family